jgi:hypothetical protein
MALTQYQKFVKANYHRFRGTPQQILQQVARAWRSIPISGGVMAGWQPATKPLYSIRLPPPTYFVPDWSGQNSYYKKLTSQTLPVQIM